MKKIHHTKFASERIDSNTKFLTRDFTVVDKRNKEWNVPAGYISDGKSVPEALEPIIGDPFEGVTEPASFVHDFECEYARFYLDKKPKKENYINYNILKAEKMRGRKINSQKDTHRIFRELVEFEMARNEEYSWGITWPHNWKGWQFTRSKLMWLGVRIWNHSWNPFNRANSKWK